MTEPTKRPGRPRTAKKEPADERPPHHRGEAGNKYLYLDEIEQQAKKRIEASGRVPATAKQKLQVSDLDPNYHHTWASDAEGHPVNLQQMLEAGYTFWRYDAGPLRGQPRVQYSKGCNLYLMRCPLEYFLEDQEKIHEKNRQQMAEVNRVGSREYGGKSKEPGQGKPLSLDYEQPPSEQEKALRLMEGDDPNQ